MLFSVFSVFMVGTGKISFEERFLLKEKNSDAGHVQRLSMNYLQIIYMRSH